MALQFNNFSAMSLASALKATAAYSPSGVLRFYPTTVAFPSTPPTVQTALPAGHILSYTILTWVVSGNTIIVSAGVTAANATAAGTLGWWSVGNGSDVVISDSIGLSGTGSIVTVNTMTPTNGQSVSFTYTLSVL